MAVTIDQPEIVAQIRLAVDEVARIVSKCCRSGRYPANHFLVIQRCRSTNVHAMAPQN